MKGQTTNSAILLIDITWLFMLRFVYVRNAYMRIGFYVFPCNLKAEIMYKYKLNAKS